MSASTILSAAAGGIIAAGLLAMLAFVAAEVLEVFSYRKKEKDDAGKAG